MRRLTSLVFRQRRLPPGAHPGAIDAATDTGVDATIDVIRYGANESERYRNVTPERARELAEPGWITWVDVVGIGDLEALASIAALFELHPLVLDDIVEVPQRPKQTSHGDNLLFIVRMLGLEAMALEIEQLGVLSLGDVVITFQERPGDVLEPVRQRIADGRGPIRGHGADYLCYALIDTVVDHYFPLLEGLGDELEELEERIIEGADEAILDELGALRTVMLRLRRSIGPLRDSMLRLVRHGEDIDDEIRVYFQAVSDHISQVYDVLESYRELATGLLNTHISVVAHRTNDVMRVLTVTASVFIPLTFIAGLYGMNFKYMPELNFRWAYPIAVGVMLSVGGVLLWLFRRRGWLGRTKESRRPSRDER